jgi:hypothetical protein
LSVSGTIDDWTVQFEDVSRGESVGSVTGSLPPLGLEDPAEMLSGLTLDDLGGNPLVLRSENGSDWSIPSQPPVLTSEAIWFSRLIAADTGFMFLVYEENEESPSDRPGELMVWTSPQGDIWQQLAGESPFDPPDGKNDKFGDEAAITSAGNVATITAGSPKTLYVIEVLANGCAR